LLLGPELLKAKNDTFVNYLVEMNKHFDDVLLEIPDAYFKRREEVKIILEHIKTALK